MNRFGWIFLLLLLAGIGVFAALVRPAAQISNSPRVAAAASAPSPPVERLPSGLVMPVAGADPGSLMDSFGQDRDGGARPHNALDVIAPLGTPVVAVAPGRIEKIFDSADGGHTVYVRSPDGRWVYYYAHLDRYAQGLVEGQAVGQGRLLGSVGFSGNASPQNPHLHFEIKRMAAGESWHQGTPVNPYPLLAARGPAR